MFEGLIIGQINNVIKETLTTFSEEFNEEAQLFLSRNEEGLRIQVLKKYNPISDIGINALNIPIVSDEVVEEKILAALQKFENEGVREPKAMLLLKNEEVIAFLYDGLKPLKQIEISKLI